MTDKELDNAIKEALTSDDVPEALNCSLFKKAQGKIKKAKIYTFTKFAATVAAVFICGVCVFSVYNSHDGEGMKQDLVKENKQEGTVEISPKAARSVNDSMQVSEEKAMAENSIDSVDTFDLRKTLTLSDLFNEGYDFKSVINEKIKEQINALPNAAEYKFSGISENVRFSLSEENTLTIIFGEGEITDSSHGEQYFTVGIVANGVLN
ncbi:MAG: DUF3298 domain-containing protein [Clostridia bacterium]|nr:DUF3298 domain-containing protein [Clostridia bacterium]